MSTQYDMEPVTTGKVILHTTTGDIEVELWCKEAPQTCRNFIQLCMEGYYNKTKFHRLVKGFILQGGDPTGTGKGGESIYGKPFKDEFHQRLRFNRRGLLGMANAEKNDNRSQFFFTIGSEPSDSRELNGKNTLFGKITGATVHNMLAMAAYEVDDEERPSTLHEIKSTTVLTNPFEDIVPREKPKKEKRQKVEKKFKKEEKKLNLLSFGNEAEEEEEEIQAFTTVMKGKSKSAHDVLSDERLSKQAAVTADEMGHYEPEKLEEEESKATVDRIRNKFSKRKIVDADGNDEYNETDLNDLMDEEKRAAYAREKEKKQAEVKAEMKEYARALRGPKTKKAAKEPEASENMKKHLNMKLKFKKKSSHIVKTKDTEHDREAQTDELMERFKKRLAKAKQEDILFDKKIEIEEDDSKGDVEVAEEKNTSVELPSPTF